MTRPTTVWLHGTGLAIPLPRLLARPRARVVVLDAGHQMPIDAADAVMPPLSRFLEDKK